MNRGKCGFVHNSRDKSRRSSPCAKLDRRATSSHYRARRGESGHARGLDERACAPAISVPTAHSRQFVLALIRRGQQIFAPGEGSRKNSDHICLVLECRHEWSHDRCRGRGCSGGDPCRCSHPSRDPYAHLPAKRRRWLCSSRQSSWFPAAVLRFKLDSRIRRDRRARASRAGSTMRSLMARKRAHRIRVVPLRFRTLVVFSKRRTTLSSGEQ